MSETSLPWAGTVTGDKGPYTDDQWSDMYRKLLAPDRDKSGVVGRNGGDLAVTAAGTNANVADGFAVVDGKFYENTATVTFSCPTNGTYYQVVLRKVFASQTVRLALKTGTPTLPALTQIDGDTWEIPLATVYNNAGTLEITDQRVYVLRVKRRYLFIPVSVVFDNSGTVSVDPDNHMDNAAGLLSTANGSGRVPQEYADDDSLAFSLVWYTPAGAPASGNLDFTTTMKIGIGTTFENPSDETIIANSNVEHLTQAQMMALSLNNVGPNWYFWLYTRRYPEGPDDTFAGDIQFLGWLMHYNALW